MGFASSQSIDGIVYQPAGVTNLGEDRGVGRAEADSQVARLIQRGASHPAPGCVRLVSALLKDHRRGRHAAQLEPTHTCHIARTHSIIAHDRFVAVTEFAIGEAEHQTIANGVQIRCTSQLGHTVSVSGTDPGKGRGSRTANEIKGGVSRRDEISMEKPHLIHTGTRE